MPANWRGFCISMISLCRCSPCKRPTHGAGACIRWGMGLGVRHDADDGVVLGCNHRRRYPRHAMVRWSQQEFSGRLGDDDYQGKICQGRDREGRVRNKETGTIVSALTCAQTNGRCPVEDADLKHRFHLMQTEIEATASLLKDAKIALTAALDDQNRGGDPEDLHGTLSSRVRQELCGAPGRSDPGDRSRMAGRNRRGNNEAG